MLDLDFSEPRWLINYYHVVGLISLVLNSFGIYLLLWECTNLGNFRYYLLGFQVTCVITDIHVDFLTQPIPLTPLFSMFTVGILSEFFDVSPHICAVFGGFITIAQLEALVLCFAKKQQNYPELLQSFLDLPNFVIYIKGLNTKLLGYSMLIGGPGLVALFLLFIADIFRSMKELRVKLSKQTYQKHQEAIQSLIVQFFSSLLCFGAPSILAIVAVMNLDNAQPITKLIIAWFTTHSSLNMISLFFFFPPYRKFFMKYTRRNTTNVNVIPPSAVF
ncbi:unnamed protein product [Caenorhabditis brenneri]